VSLPEVREWVSFGDPEEVRTWLFDVTFLESRWTCIFGRGCQGVLPQRAPELGLGCCSHGAHFTDEADRTRVERLAARLGPDQWQHAAVGRARGVAAREPGGALRTRRHDGACIFLNRPGFLGGGGCALHRAALDAGERPLDWKPEVCWQLPLRRVDSTDELGHVTSTVREWKRRDWDEGGFDFAWWCTEGDDAFVGSAPVWRALADELVALVGRPVYDRLTALLAGREATRARRTTRVPRPTVRRRRA
jgi:hypothetical protein